MLDETFSKCAQRADKESCRCGASRGRSSVGRGRGAHIRKYKFCMKQNFTGMKAKKKKEKKTFVVFVFLFFSFRATRFRSLKRTQK